MLDLDVQPEREVSLVELAVSQWVYLMQFAEANTDTYSKVLVPLDLTEQSEKILPHAAKLLRADGEGILLHVIQDNSESTAPDDSTPLGFTHPNMDSSKPIEYLTGVVGRTGIDPSQWRWDVIEAPSVADGVANFAAQEDVEIIAMYVHERKGLAKLTGRSIAKDIKQKSPADVRFFRSREL
jgi:nucleotide-binding universal stress UspA family protein